jgi:hypothetical protein
MFHDSKLLPHREQPFSVKITFFEHSEYLTDSDVSTMKSNKGQILKVHVGLRVKSFHFYPTSTKMGRRQILVKGTNKTSQKYV